MLEEQTETIRRRSKMLSTKQGGCWFMHCRALQKSWQPGLDELAADSPVYPHCFAQTEIG